jgi:TRAP-type C4-dicarboxylate transport system permease small subunit
MSRSVSATVDTFSRFSGLAVGQFCILSAIITLYEVISRYAFDAPTQ